MPINHFFTERVVEIIMLQDSKVSSSSLPGKTSHLVLKKTFHIDEDFLKCTKEVANQCTKTMVAHFCSATKMIKTAIGKKDGPLDPSKPYSADDVNEILSSHTRRGKYLIVSCRRDVSVESTKKEISLSYPLAIWLWRRRKEDDTVKEETELINMEHSPYAPWFTVLVPDISKNLGCGMDGVIDYIFRNVLIDHSFSLFKEKVLECNITQNAVKIGVVKAHVREDVMNYSQEPNVARMIELADGKCDGRECEDLMRDSDLFENNEWISTHSV